MASDEVAAIGVGEELKQRAVAAHHEADGIDPAPAQQARRRVGAGKTQAARRGEHAIAQFRMNLDQALEPGGA